MAALCKAPTKSAGIGLSITAVCKNAGKKTLGHDDFFVVYISNGHFIVYRNTKKEKSVQYRNTNSFLIKKRELYYIC